MADSGDSGSERRRWPRAPLHGEIVGQIYTEHAAPIIDLSEGGALVEVPCALRPRSSYTVRIGLEPGTMLVLKSNVVRSYVHHFEPTGEGESRVRYHAALQFLDIRDADREALRRRLATGETVQSGMAASLTHTGHPPHEAAAPLTEGERRDSMRVEIDGSIAGEVGLHLESQVLILSPGGMTVRMPFNPELGSVVSCTLDVDGTFLLVTGMVRDAQEDASVTAPPLHYIVGLEFIDIEEATRARIAAYLATKQPPPDS